MTHTSFILLTTTQQLSFTTTTILTTTLTPTQAIATNTDPPVDKPTSSPTIDDSPHADCLAVDYPEVGAEITIWENYIASQSQDLSLAAALDSRCGLNLVGTDSLSMDWTTTKIAQRFGLPDNKYWVSTFEHTFLFPNAVVPDGLQCIQQAIIDAGGPAIPSCGYTPG
ncbi:hypothetical protein NA56DRAFT_733165 [Hyaloscypha hepaticicola]|uniref:Uncharacterized protein n=1 Tax=Hyaloscypha hepaticicola TaxID=2082293 RepID=A0A2J6QJ77_9HELO|nr:hypothetical protein NA56DRAFT_733165 [Hyaloscypha hepaticicola]